MCIRAAGSEIVPKTARSVYLAIEAFTLFVVTAAISIFTALTTALHWWLWLGLWSLTKAVSRILNGFNSRCLHTITGEEYRVTAISPAYNLLLSVRQRRLRYLGHLLRLPYDSVVRRTLVAMAGGGNRYPEGSLFMDCQGSELKDLETLAVNRTTWRSKVTTLVV